MSNVSLFSDINEVKIPTYLSVEHALERIKNGKSRNLIEKIRNSVNGDIARLKMNLPCVCFSGTFKLRNKQDVIAHSGVICLDYDHVNVPVTIETLKSDKYTHACWVSPSGTGVKALVKIPANIVKHEMYFDALREAYPQIDTKCRDISRVCYESYDPNIYINHASVVWDKLIEREEYDYTERKPAIPLTNEGEIIKRIEKWLDNKGEKFTEGNRNAWVHKAAGAMNRFGVSEYSALSFLGGFSAKGFAAAEIEKSVKSAYKAKDQHNTSYFENIQIRKDIQRDIQLGKSVKAIVDMVVAGSAATESQAQEVIEEERQRADDKLEVFWEVFTDKHGKQHIELNRKKFIRFLFENGFNRYKLSSSILIYIRIFDNQVSEVYPHDIKTFVFNWIDQMEDSWFDGINKRILYEFMAKGIKTFFASDLLDLLPISDVKLNEDSAKVAYFYYINGAVEVTKDGVRLINFSDLNGKVWKDQIIQRHIVLVDDFMHNSYCQFLEKICADKDQSTALMSVIGYLLHKYKDKRFSKAPVLTDQQSMENPEGGSGKGLIIDGIRQIRKVVTMDGKNFNTSKNFVFQRVDVDTELIFIDDLPKGFIFENLFSIITEGIPVEKKNKGEYWIPFERSPKVVLSTNYYLKGEGSSNDRRKVDVEINNFFNAQHTPFDEFGETLFADWDNNTWNDFDNSMMSFCKFYLANGIISMVNDSIDRKKLQANTCPEFIEFAPQIPVNIELNRRIIYDQFMATYPGYYKLHIRTFIGWIGVYCAHKNLPFNKEVRRSHNDFFMIITDVNRPTPPPEEEKAPF